MFVIAVKGMFDFQKMFEEDIGSQQKAQEKPKMKEMNFGQRNSKPKETQGDLAAISQN